MKATPEMTRTARNAYHISLGMTFVALVAFVGIIYSTLTGTVPTPTPWQIYAAPTLPLPILVGALLGIWYSRQNKPVQAGKMIIGSMMITAFLVPSIAARRGAYLAIVVAAISVSIATMTMPNVQANRIIRAVVAIGVTIVLVDLFYPFSRLPGVNITPIGLIVLSIGAAIFAILAAVQFHTFQLQTKLLVLFALVPGLIVTIIGAFLITTINSQLLQQAQIATIDNLAAKESSLTELLADTDADVQFLSRSALLADYLSMQATAVSPVELAIARNRLEAELLAFAQSRQIYDQVRFIDTNGQEIVRINTTRTGQSTAVAMQDLQDKSGRYYFEETLARSPGDIYISPLELNVEEGQIEEPHTPVIRFGTSVTSNGRKAGIVIINVMAEPLLAELADTGYQTFLVDKDGYYLYHPDSDKQWGRELATGITLAQDVPTLAEATTFTNLSGITDTEIDADYYAFTPISLANETAPRWTLINHVPAEVLWTPINNTLAPIQAILSISLLLTPLLAIFVSNSIGAPIARITRAAQQVADNELSIDLDISRQDELGTLADAFTQMTQRLRSLVDALETRVTERTRDLVLAAEVSSRVTQVRGVDELLSEAVEIIRSRFDLYYTQIYLVEQNQLVLHAGTGSVGNELLERQFRLPLGPGSINGTAAAEKQPIIVADTATSPLFRPNPLLPRTRSEMSVPLLVGERIVGVLNLQSSVPNALTDTNLPAFKALAGQLAIAIENARLFAEADKSRAELEAQARFQTHTGWDNYLNGVDQQEFIGYRFENDQTTPITLPDVGNGRSSRATPIAVNGAPIGQVQVGQIGREFSPVDQDLIETVAKQVGQRLENLRLLSEAEQYRHEAEEAARRLTRQDWSAFRQEQALPGFVYDQMQIQPLPEDGAPVKETLHSKQLRVRGEIIGHLLVDDPATADEEEEEILTAVATQLSQHLENLRLTDLTQQRATQLTIIDQVAQAVSREIEVDKIIDTIYKQIPVAFPSDAFHIGIYDPESNTVDYPLVYENGIRNAQRGVPLSSNSNMKQVLDSEAPLLRNLSPAEVAEIQASSDEYLLGDGSIPDPTVSLMFAPLRAGQRVFGAISVQSHQYNAFTDADLTLLTGIANYIAVGLENARLFTQTEKALTQSQKRSTELARINHVISAVAATVDLQESLQILAEEVIKATQADQIGVGLLNEAGTHLQIVADQFDPELSTSAMGALIPVHGNQATEQVLSTRKTIVIEDVQNNPMMESIRPLMVERNVHEMILVPMVAGQEVIGTFGLDILSPDRHFTPNQIRFTEVIVLQATTAVQKARLFEQTQAALSETASLYQASTALNEAATLQEILHVLKRHTILGQKAQQVAIDYFNRPWTESQQPDYFEVLAFNSTRADKLAQTRYELADFPEIKSLLSSDAPTLIEDVATTEHFSERTKHLYLKVFGSRSTVFIPLTVSGKWLGFVNALFAEPTSLTDIQLRRLMSIANQAAVALQGILLLEQTTARARREELLRSIAAKLRSSANVDVVMRTAVREVGQALGRQAYIYLDQDGNGTPDPTQEDA